MNDTALAADVTAFVARKDQEFRWYHGLFRTNRGQRARLLLEAGGGRTWALAVFLSSLLSFSTAQSSFAGPSFDCAKASTPVEKAICRDDDLSNLDKALGKIYEEKLSSLAGAQVIKLYSDQVSWLSRRSSVCNLYSVNKSMSGAGGQVQCLITSYRERISAIEALTRSSTARVPFNGFEVSYPEEKILSDWRLNDIFLFEIYDRKNNKCKVLSEDGVTVYSKESVDGDGCRVTKRYLSNLSAFAGKVSTGIVLVDGSVVSKNFNLTSKNSKNCEAGFFEYISVNRGGVTINKIIVRRMTSGAVGLSSGVCVRGSANTSTYLTRDGLHISASIDVDGGGTLFVLGSGFVVRLDSDLNVLPSSVNDVFAINADSVFREQKNILERDGLSLNEAVRLVDGVVADEIGKRSE